MKVNYEKSIINRKRLNLARQKWVVRQKRERKMSINNVKLARTFLEIEMQTMADYCAMTLIEVGEIENGEVIPNSKQAERISEFLQIPIKELMVKKHHLNMKGAEYIWRLMVEYQEKLAHKPLK